MATFEAQCPQCGNGFEAQEDWVGQDGECPSCGASIKIALPVSKRDQQGQGALPQKQPAIPRKPGWGAIRKKSSSLVLKRKPVEGKSLPPPPSDPPPKTEEVEPGPAPDKAPAPETFKFICPECNTSVSMPKDMLGKEIECAGCLEKVLVSIPEHRLCPHCGKQIKLAAKVCKHCKMPVSEVPADAEMPLPDEKTCPHCGKLIKRAAQICKHCKARLEVPATPPSGNENAGGNPWGGIAFLALIAALAYPALHLFGMTVNPAAEGVLVIIVFIGVVLSAITSAGKPQGGQG